MEIACDSVTVALEYFSVSKFVFIFNEQTAEPSDLTLVFMYFLGVCDSASSLVVLTILFQNIVKSIFFSLKSTLQVSREFKLFFCIQLDLSITCSDLSIQELLICKVTHP
jgi:hypothetical protein